MARRPPLPSISLRPRSWLTRAPGECAFPVDGESWATRSCCNPCAAPPYCAQHRRVMRGPRAPSLRALERDLARFID